MCVGVVYLLAHLLACLLACRLLDWFMFIGLIGKHLWVDGLQAKGGSDGKGGKGGSDGKGGNGSASYAIRSFWSRSSLKLMKFSADWIIALTPPPPTDWPSGPGGASYHPPGYPQWLHVGAAAGLGDPSSYRDHTLHHPRSLYSRPHVIACDCM